jgi:hypothetical protein
VSLQEGLARTVAYYREHLAQYLDAGEQPAGGIG